MQRFKAMVKIMVKQLNHIAKTFHELYFQDKHQVLLMLVLKVLFMKSLCYMIQLFTHCLYHCFESLHSSHMLYNSMIKVMQVACHYRNYSFYRLPTRGRVGTKLGDADTSPTYP